MAGFQSLEEHVLIVDDDAAFRNVVAAQLRQAGCAAKTAATYEEGLQLFTQDSAIKLVILDHPTIGARVDGVVNAMRNTRPDTTIIGNSGSDRRHEFAAAGVKHFLQKPWRISDLLDLLNRRIEFCVDCNWPLPLLRPCPGEPAQRWVCAVCGARYRAVLDRSAPTEVQRNVVSANDVERDNAPVHNPTFNPGL